MREHRSLRRRQREFAERRAIEDARDRQADALAGGFAAALQRRQGNVGGLGDAQRDRVAGLRAELGCERFADQRLAAGQREVVDPCESGRSDRRCRRPRRGRPMRFDSSCETAPPATISGAAPATGRRRSFAGDIVGERGPEECRRRDDRVGGAEPAERDLLQALAHRRADQQARRRAPPRPPRRRAPPARWWRRSSGGWRASAWR